MSNEFFDSIWEQVPDHRHSAHGWMDALAAEFAGGAATVLDLGCGDGRYLAALASGGSRVAGADRSAVALERAAARAAAAGLGDVDLREAGPDELVPFDDNAFERVWCCGVLEHVVDTQTALSEIRRVLVPGGELMALTPGTSRRQRLELALRGWERHFDPFSSRLRFYTARSLAGALRDCGFEDPAIESRNGLLVARAKRL